MRFPIRHFYWILTGPSFAVHLYLKYPEVEDDHDAAGDVEGADGRVDDEVWIVEGADEWLTRLLLAEDGQGAVPHSVIHLRRYI
jgi:hypothetical protein